MIDSDSKTPLLELNQPLHKTNQPQNSLTIMEPTI